MLSITCDAVDVDHILADRACRQRCPTTRIYLPGRECADWQGMSDGLLRKQVLLRSVTEATKPAFDTASQRWRCRCAANRRRCGDRDTFRYALTFVPYFAEHIGVSCCRSSATAGAALHVSYLI